MHLHIKTMTKSETDGKAYVHWKSWQETYKNSISHKFLKQFTFEKCREIARLYPENTIVAAADGKIAGFAAYGKCRDQEAESDAGEVYAIYVLQEYQKKKIGYHLMQSCFKLLSKYKRIVVWVLKENKSAITFYEQNGFCADGKEKELIFDPAIPNTVIRMVLERKMKNIRKAKKEDLSRIAEIYVFNNRVNYWPIFKDEGFSFGELQVVAVADGYFGKEEVLKNITVYDDGIIKGFIHMTGTELSKIYVDPFFQSKGIGKELLEFAVKEYSADNLWALEKNKRAVSFYLKNGFQLTGERKLEEGTIEYIVHLSRCF